MIAICNSLSLEHLGDSRYSCMENTHYEDNVSIPDLRTHSWETSLNLHRKYCSARSHSQQVHTLL